MQILIVFLMSMWWIDRQARKHAAKFKKKQKVNHFIENGKRCVLSLICAILVHSNIDYRVFVLAFQNMFPIGGFFMYRLNQERGLDWNYISKQGGFWDRVFIKLPGQGTSYYLVLVVLWVVFAYYYLTI